MFFKRFLSTNYLNNYTQHHPLFKHYQLTQNVWRIEEKYFDSWNLANIFYIRGSTSDLLVDTGIGVHDLPSFLRWSGLRPDPDKPLKVALTHTHFDHSGGAHQFAQCSSGIYVHKEEAEVMLRGSKYLSASWITPDELIPKPSNNWNASEYNVKPIAAKVLKHLSEGENLHLGHKSVEVFHFPGHSRGSVGMLCRDEGVLITGDTVYATDHELIDWYPGSSVGKMIQSVERILHLANAICLALPGHNDVLTKDELEKACENHLRQSSGTGRKWRKGLSRTRANIILAANSRFNLPSQTREWIKN